MGAMWRSVFCAMVGAGALVALGVGCDRKPVAPPPDEPAAPTSQPDTSAQTLLNQAKAEGEAAFNKARDAGSDLFNVAQKELDQAAEYAKKKRPEVADTILSEVEKHKSSLPQSMQDRLVSLRKQVDADKVATRPASQGE